MSFRKRPQDYVNPSFKQRLRETPVRELLSGWPKLIIARSTDSIATVFQRLIDHNIFGMPLLDVKTNKYTAFIDLFDILAYLVENNLPIEPNEEWLVNNEFANNSCLMLVGKSLRSAWVLIGEDSSLQAAINQLQTVHRLAVVDSRGNLVGVLSQSRVAKWLAQRNDASIGDLANMTIDDFNFGFCDVQTIHQDEQAVRAFVRMYKNDLSGLAVVDDNDRVIGNISVSDLKGIQKTRGMFRNLFVSCRAFINRNEMPKPPVLVSATRNTSMKEVLERYKDNNIHRVYVVTPGMHRPIGVVTMTDMMSAFATPQTTA